jgi:membrane associated rhomboid family serine protease
VAIYLLLSLRSLRPADLRPRLAEYVRSFGRTSRRSLDQDVVQQVSSTTSSSSPGLSPRSLLLALFASMFLHGGFAHLFGNMLFLWIYGDNVEHRLGSARYVFWYVLTGACATLFHAVFDSDSRIPLVGASGAISGVLGFYFLWFPRNQVRVWVLLFRSS